MPSADGLEMGPQTYNHKKPNSADILYKQGNGFSLGDSGKSCHPADPLISTLWDTEDKSQPSPPRLLTYRTQIISLCSIMLVSL